MDTLTAPAPATASCHGRAWRGWPATDTLPEAAAWGTVATVGVFDGLHRGHQQLVDRAVTRAAQLKVPALMVTFDPHPLVVLRPEAAPRQLMDVEERIAGALRLGLDGVVVLPFTRAMAATSAEDFVRHGLVGALGVRSVIVGSNFSCGRAGHGDIDYLREAGEWHGFEVEALDLVRVRDRVCSSTEVRRLLAEGRHDVAAELLGRRSA